MMLIFEFCMIVSGLLILPSILVYVYEYHCEVGFEWHLRLATLKLIDALLYAIFWPGIMLFMIIELVVLIQEQLTDPTPDD